MFIITRLLAKRYAKKNPNRLNEVLDELERLEYTERSFWENYIQRFPTTFFSNRPQWDKMDNSFIAKGFDINFCLSPHDNPELVNITVYRFKHSKLHHLGKNPITSITVYRQDFKRINKVLTGSWGFDFTQMMSLLKQIDNK